MNKNTKVYVGDKQLKVKRVRKPISNKTFAVVVMIMLATIVAYMFFPRTNTVIEIKEVEVVKEVAIKASVLDRIAKCESNGSHYDKNGQVLVRGNEGSRASVDIGLYQINGMYWGKKATELGLNLFVEEDNRKMAEYIFNNFGTDAWSASRKCWSK